MLNEQDNKEAISDEADPRLLVVGDTHCRFDRLEQMIALEQQRGPVAAALHCGDIGLYDEDSLFRLPAKEVKLIQRHQNPIELCYPYLSAKRALPVPLWGIPGNHEDFVLVEQLEQEHRRLPNLSLLTPGQRVTIELGTRPVTVMGLGRILPGDVSPRNRGRPKYISPEAMARTMRRGQGAAPDILLLHEPPWLWSAGGRGAFGSEEISRLVRALAPRLVICGHMHFEYRAELDGIDVVGVGYGVRGRYAVVDRELNLEFGDLEGHDATVSDAEEPPLPRESDLRELKERDRQRKRQNRLGRIPLPVTGRDVIRHFSLGRLRKAGRRKVNKLMGQLRRHMVEHGELSRDRALQQAEQYLRDNELLPR